MEGTTNMNGFFFLFISFFRKSLSIGNDSPIFHILHRVFVLRWVLQNCFIFSSIINLVLQLLNKVQTILLFNLFLILFNLFLLLFIGLTAFFSIIYRSHRTISISFYLYLQYVFLIYRLLESSKFHYWISLFKF